VIALLGVLASLFGAGSVVVPAAGHHGGGSTAQLRPVAPVASASIWSSVPAPSRAVRPAAGSRLAGRSARGTGQAEAVAAHHDRAPAQAAGTKQGSAAPPRLRWLGWPLPPRPLSAPSRLPAGLPSGRAPPRPAGT
jgi:hypothetical protein